VGASSEPPFVRVASQFPGAAHVVPPKAEPVLLAPRLRLLVGHVVVTIGVVVRRHPVLCVAVEEEEEKRLDVVWMAPVRRLGRVVFRGVHHDTPKALPPAAGRQQLLGPTVQMLSYSIPFLAANNDDSQVFHPTTPPFRT
jgi:hypothetical protein